jgi:Na+/melibiose symporter-like transporter
MSSNAALCDPLMTGVRKQHQEAENVQHRLTVLEHVGYGLGHTATNLGTGIAGAITGWVLTFFGYVANVEQSAAALFGIRLLISVLPAAAYVLAIAVFPFYRIDQRMLATIQKDLALRKGEVTV